MSKQIRKPDPSISKAKQKMLERAAKRKKVAVAVAVAAPASAVEIRKFADEKIRRGVAVLEQIPQRLMEWGGVGRRPITRMVFSRALEGGLDEKIRCSYGIPARRPRPANEICGEYLGIGFSMEESEEFFIRLFSGKYDVDTILEPAPSITFPPLLNPDTGLPIPSLEELMPDIAAKPFRIPPGMSLPPISTAKMTWSTSFLDPKEIKVAIPIAAHELPLVLHSVDRSATPRDALGPTPGIVRQVVLGTAAWPKYIEIEKSILSQFDQRLVRYIFEDLRLYFWLANGCAVYDVNENLEGTELHGTLLHGAVFPLIPPTPKE